MLQGSKGGAALFPKHFLKLSEAVPSWVYWPLKRDFFHNSTLSHYCLISFTNFPDSFFQVFVPCQISFTCSNGKKIIIYERIQRDRDE